MGRVHRVALAMLAMATVGCIGSIDRAEFDEEVRRRGGGVSTVWIEDSLTAAAERLDVDSTADVQLLALAIDTTDRSLTISARRGDRPDFVDSVTVREGDVIAVTPLQDADELPLDDLTVALGSVPVDRFEVLVDEALAAFDQVDASVASITVGVAAGEPTVTITLDSPRRTGQAVFAGDGTLIEVTS